MRAKSTVCACHTKQKRHSITPTELKYPPFFTKSLTLRPTANSGLYNIHRFKKAHRLSGGEQTALATLNTITIRSWTVATMSPTRPLNHPNHKCSYYRTGTCHVVKSSVHAAHNATIARVLTPLRRIRTWDCHTETVGSRE